MDFLDFPAHPLALNLAVFAGAAVAVWIAGTRVSAHAQALANRTGIDRAVVGLIILGGITSLPELAVVVSAAAAGEAALAVNNLLGGVAMQVAILSIGDLAIGAGAISAIVGSSAMLLQASLDILLLVVIAAGIAVGDVPVLGAGAWSIGVLVLYVVSIWMISRYRADAAWRPVIGAAAEPGQRKRPGEGGLAAPIRGIALGGIAILAAGWLLSRTGEAIATQTGLGTSFVGAVLIAISTSLPEVSTVLGALRLREHAMAFSDIFGTNLFDLGLIFLVDAVAAGEPVLNRVGTFSIVAALLGIAVTTIFLAGLIERKDRTVLRMGYDSAAVLVVYLAGLVVLYTLR